jgi:hypothetical protein
MSVGVDTFLFPISITYNLSLIIPINIFILMLDMAVV